MLLKRYLREAGSVRARVLLRRHRVLTSALAPVEVTSAVARRREDGDLAPEDFQAIMKQLQQDRLRWHLVEITAEVLGRAEAVVTQARVRTLDAIHLASALAVEAALNDPRRRIAFVTGDMRQRDAAQVLGLRVAWVG